MAASPPRRNEEQQLTCLECLPGTQLPSSVFSIYFFLKEDYVYESSLSFSHFWFPEATTARNFVFIIPHFFFPLHLQTILFLGFPGGARGKGSAC